MRSLFSLCFGFILGLAFAPASAELPAPLPAPNLALKTNGFVYAWALQPDGSVVFGGSFSSVNGEARYNIARLRPDGLLDAAWKPSFENGLVHALAVDSTGDIYAGGNFAQVDGYPRDSLVKLSGSTGTVDLSWSPVADGWVFALALDGNGALFTGGDFRQIGQHDRAHIAKIDAGGTGEVDMTWNPSANGFVRALVLDGKGSLFVGGSFSTIGARERQHVAKLATSGSGVADADWNPSASATVPSSQTAVHSLAVAGDALYVAGRFDGIGGQARQSLAKVSTTGQGAADANWNPNPQGVYVAAVAVDGGGAVYVGGTFWHIGGAIRSSLAKLSGTGTGAADPGWNHELSAAAQVLTLMATPAGDVHAAGYFDRVDGQLRLGAVSIRASNLLGPAADIEVPAPVEGMVAQPDGGMVLHGHFLTANRLSRRGILRLLPGGELDTAWDARLNDSSSVRAVAVDANGAIYAGGYFQRIAGETRLGVAKLTGGGECVADPAWRPDPNGPVFALATGGDAVYIGGRFTQVGGLARNHLAKVSTATGAVDAVWNPDPDAEVETLAVIGDAVYAYGQFEWMGGQTHRHLAKVDAGGAGAGHHWWYGVNGRIRGFTPDGNGAIYIHGEFTHVGPVVRAYVAKLIGEYPTADPYWIPHKDWFSSVNALVVDRDGAVYIGGTFGTMGGQPRAGLARVYGSGTGIADPGWHPMTHLDEYRTVSALALDAGGAVYVAGSFETIGGQARSGVAAVPVSSGIFADTFEIVTVP